MLFRWISVSFRRHSMVERCPCFVSKVWPDANVVLAAGSFARVGIASGEGAGSERERDEALCGQPALHIHVG